MFYGDLGQIHFNKRSTVSRALCQSVDLSRALRVSNKGHSTTAGPLRCTQNVSYVLYTFHNMLCIINICCVLFFFHFLFNTRYAINSRKRVMSLNIYNILMIKNNYNIKTLFKIHVSILHNTIMPFKKVDKRKRIHRCVLFLFLSAL